MEGAAGDKAKNVDVVASSSPTPPTSTSTTAPPSTGTFGIFSSALSYVGGFLPSRGDVDAARAALKFVPLCSIGLLLDVLNIVYKYNEISLYDVE